MIKKIYPIFTILLGAAIYAFGLTYLEFLIISLKEGRQVLPSSPFIFLKSLFRS